MKRKSRTEVHEDVRPEYDLAKLLRKGIRGKYAHRYRKGSNIVLLAPDVARAFRTDDAVNEALRLVIRLGKLQGGPKRVSPKKQRQPQD